MAVTSAVRSHSLVERGGARLAGKACRRRRNVRNGFLNVKFGKIPGSEIPLSKTAIFTIEPKSEIERLRGDVASFYKQFNLDLELPAQTGDIHIDLSNLYQHLCSNMPYPDWRAEIVRKGGDDSPVHFIIYKVVEDFPEETIFTIPIKVLEDADDKTRELLVNTFAILHRHDMYAMPYDNHDMQYVLGMPDNFGECDANGHPHFDPEQEEFMDDETKEWATRYVCGDINDLFKEIDAAENSEMGGDMPLFMVVERLIKKYREEGYKNTRLLDAVEKIAAVSKEAWLSDFHLSIIRTEFGYDFASDEYHDSDDFMDFGRLFYFCYALDDPVNDATVRCISEDGYSLSVGPVMCYSNINCDNIRERMSNSFPRRWVEANTNFIELIQ